MTHYNYFMEKYTPNDSMYVGWSSKEKQDLLHRLIALHARGSILDIGCGVGDLSGYYGKDYLGIDEISEMVLQAKLKHPNKEFRCESLYRTEEKRDWVVACGSFNLKRNGNIIYLTENIEKMYSLARKGVVFNVTSRHSTEKNEDCYYYDPGQIFNIVKHRYRKVSLDHSYLDDDFMVIITKQ